MGTQGKWPSRSRELSVEKVWEPKPATYFLLNILRQAWHKLNWNSALIFCTPFSFVSCLHQHTCAWPYIYQPISSEQGASSQEGKDGACLQPSTSTSAISWLLFHTNRVCIASSVPSTFHLVSLFEAATSLEQGGRDKWGGMEANPPPPFLLPATRTWQR